MNPLFKALGNTPVSGLMGNFGQIIQQFNRFKANFQGDPEAEVKRLLQSGRISQEQLNQLQQAAQMLQQLL